MARIFLFDFKKSIFYTYSMRLKNKIITISIIFLFLACPVFAIDKAEKITDREIIESLVEIREGQKSIREDILELKEFDKFIIAELKDNKNELKEYIDSSVNNVNKSIGNIRDLIYIILAGIFGFIGFIIWDRRESIKPLLKCNNKLEKKEKRLEDILKKYALEEPRLAAILKSYGLM